jgi:outer membrane protein OmpA-like peptidoglycan-associated protein
MPGTLGSSDLFKAPINVDGSIGTPINLGKGINTPGRESFPFLTKDNELYFATDARQGLGGLDIYISKVNNDGTFSPPINIGAPVNGPVDDFAFYIDSKSKKGFFTSNRSTGKGFDDIYSFTEIKQLQCEHELIVNIIDEETKKLIPNGTIIFFNNKMEEITKMVGNDKGEYKLAVNCGEQYYIRTVNQDYDVKEMKVVIPNTTGKTTAVLELRKKIIEMKEQDDIFVKLDINMIYFDLDKSVIRNDAALELEKILDVMNQYPNMKVDVRSHTDSRQTTKYNATLSDKRVKESIAWLVKNGISSNRLSGRGYGESQLVNKCADGVPCTEAEHQLNRRSEFIIIKL